MVDYLAQKFVRNLDIEAYHSLKDIVSSSQLKELSKSPAHYKAALDASSKRTAALEFGDAAHTFILQPREFERRFITMPLSIKVKRGKDWDAFSLAHSDKSIISAEDFETIVSMDKALTAHKTAKALLNLDTGIPEMSCFFKDPSTGLSCRIRPDFLPGGNIIVDYKTTENATPSEFQRSCAKYGYDIQAGFYCLGMELLTGVAHKFVFIAQEKKPPYEVAVYEASPDFIDTGRTKAIRLLQLLAECRATGIYPGYPDEIQTLDMPAWAKAA